MNDKDRLVLFTLLVWAYGVAWRLSATYATSEFIPVVCSAGFGISFLILLRKVINLPERDNA